MTTKVTVNPSREVIDFQSDESPQNVVDLEWNSRGKWYSVSRVTITHNPEYPTPTISVIQPHNGIGFRVFDLDGNLVYTNKKTKESE